MFDRAAMRGNEEYMIMPVCLDVSDVQGVPGAFRISDSHGYVPTSEEFWTFVDHVARFYNVASDEDIQAHNRRRYAEDIERYQAAAHPPRPAPKRRVEPGFVYLLKGQGYYKIGRAKDPHRRSETLAVQLPFPTEMVAHVHSPDYKALEAELHQRFVDKRLNGEWFDLSDEDVEYIKGLAP
jgi:hypothetical protein